MLRMIHCKMPDLHAFRANYFFTLATNFEGTPFVTKDELSDGTNSTPFSLDVCMPIRAALLRLIHGRYHCDRIAEISFETGAHCHQLQARNAILRRGAPSNQRSRNVAGSRRAVASLAARFLGRWSRTLCLESRDCSCSGHRAR